CARGGLRRWFAYW
nr:immunoglobulin heavy chain junction region [Mus musculus]MBK4190087.1 immunoglobulin heavy chain junction region [Mus musculus]